MKPDEQTHGLVAHKTKKENSKTRNVIHAGNFVG